MKLITIIITLLITNASFAGSYIVMSSTSQSTDERIDIDDLRSIFLGNKLFWQNGDRIYPAHVNKNSNAMTSFTETTLKMGARQFNSYWRRRLFSGKGHPPIELDTDEKTLDYISKTSGAIGIVSRLPRVRKSGMFFFEPSKNKLELKIVN